MDELQNAPKQFCENIRLGFSDDAFFMAMLSGGTGTVYAMTPQHAKKLSQYLAHNIKKYEEANGEISAEWVEGVQSPIQSADLSGGKSEGDSEGGADSGEDSDDER